ncbi:MAG: uroporphyrinogen-III synthase [Alicyclobacillaceae bacterium]|nr:uroporphyrinogen-III synthase [Alicyclobacillaceae bacterium]
MAEPGGRPAAAAPDLAGWTVIITRPEQQAAIWAQAVRARGGTALVRPLIEVVPRPAAQLAPALADLARYDAVVATSANALRVLAQVVGACSGAAEGGRTLAPLCYTVGEATARAAVRLGFRAECPPAGEGGTAEALAEWLALQWAGGPAKRVLFLAGQLAGDRLPEVLRAAGHPVDVLVCYDTRPVAVNLAEWREWLRRSDVAVVLFSPSAARSLAAQCGTDWAGSTGSADHRGRPERAAVVCLGPTTAAACQTVGLPVDGVAHCPDVDAVLDVVVRLTRA